MSAFLTAADVAESWGKSRRFVYEQLNSGALEGSYFGGQWHITQEAVDAYVKAHTRKAPAAPKGRRRPRRAA
jgi:excisionase family DNA binding protein